MFENRLQLTKQVELMAGPSHTSPYSRKKKHIWQQLLVVVRLQQFLHCFRVWKVIP